ncbi:hypothetical protein PMG11_05996 [Penicillium brasilianum]|uniref:Uncharacterized protein n=1 Tax=Penicillium brasilianum TaxID=104259 RepID=A0A0F7TL10_PENBI|nr:hypothetical protein PMG11_05996 [Penicillium brasilianum]
MPETPDPVQDNPRDFHQLSVRNIGEPLVIPEAHAGEMDRPPAEWAHFIWLAPFRVARQTRQTRQTQHLKGKLHELLKNEPVRELTCRKRYFASGRRQDEIIGNSLANVESAAVFCQGVVQLDEKQCDSCLKAFGPWAKCVQLEGGEGHLAACANCIWNGKHERCSLWRNAQTGSTPERQNQGHQRNKPSISKKMASDAWAEAKRILSRVKGLSAKIVQALENEQFERASALLEEQKQWIEDFKRPEGILDLFFHA